MGYINKDSGELDCATPYQIGMVRSGIVVLIGKLSNLGRCFCLFVSK